MPPVHNFVRAEVFPSGYLIRPCEGGGSMIHIVDHMNLEVICLLYHSLHSFRKICAFYIVEWIIHRKSVV